MRQLADGGGLAHAVDADNHYHIRLFAGRRHKFARACAVVVLGKHIADFFAKQVVEFVHVDIFVAGHSCLYAVYDFEGRLGPDVAGYKNFLELVKKIVVDGAAAGKCATQFAEYTFFCLLQAPVEVLLFILAEEIKKSHVVFIAKLDYKISEK